MPNVTSQQFYSDLNKKLISPIYFLAGEEAYEQDEALKSIEKALSADSLNREVFFGNESKIEEILSAYQTAPFLGDRRLVIVKNANKIRANDIEKLTAYLAAPVSSTCLVLIWPERITKDTKAKDLIDLTESAGTFIEFKKRYDRELPSWISEKAAQKGKKIDYTASQLLIEESGSSLLDLTNEIEKLDLFTGKIREITADDVEMLSGHTKNANLNLLAEVLETRNLNLSLKIIEELLEEGEEPIRILFRLYWVMRRLLLAKSLLEEDKADAAQIRRALRLHNYFDRNFFINLKKFSLGELKVSIELLMKADLELKTSARPAGLIFDEMAFILCGRQGVKA